MRIIKSIIILLILATAAKAAATKWNAIEENLTRRDTDAKEPDDISDFYGFGEIEIVKLDWGIQNLLIADFDGDGRNDIAVANNIKAGIEILIQKEQIGLEDTEVAVDAKDQDINELIGPSRFHRQTVPVSQRIYSMVCGDLNSDGLIDLAFYGEPRGLYVMTQKPKDKSGREKNDLNWDQKKRINILDALPNENALVCADVNNDGRMDLIIVSRDAVYIVLQKQDGSLAEPVKFASAAKILGADAGDLNGDGRCDLVIVTDEREKPIHVRLGQKTNQLGPEIRLAAENPLALELADIDGEKGREIVAIDAISRRLTCYKFTSDSPSDDDWTVLLYPLAAGEGSEKRDLVIGDFDGDGLADVVISDPGAAELIWYRQAKGVGLAEPARFPALAGADSLSAADIDGDGKSEVAVLSIKEKAIGISRFDTGRLSFPHALDLSGEPLAMELADIDADGAVDCAYVARSQTDTRSFRVIYNVATAHQQSDPNSQAEVELTRLRTNPQGIKVVDVDRDGLKDVLIFIRYELPILIRQAENRMFEVVDSPGAKMSLIKEATVRSTGVADVDGQPGDELLVAQDNFARSLAFADGSWTVIDQYNAKSAENRISAVATAQLNVSNATHLPQILLLDGQKGQLQILTAGSDKTYRFDKEVDIGRWNTAAGIKMTLASLTTGNTEDIVLFDSEKFAIIIPSGEGASSQRLNLQFNYQTKIKDGSYGNLTTGDINSDGRMNLIMVEYKHNHMEILSLDSTGKPIPAMRFKIFEEKHYRESRPRSAASVEPRQLDVADVTGDGREDLVTIIHDRIIVYPQD